MERIDRGGGRHDDPGAASWRDALDEAAALLEAGLRAVPGAWVERKRFAVVAHDREVDDAGLPAVLAAVRSAHAKVPALRVVPGRRVHEFRPPLGVDKGAAVLDVLATLDGAGPWFPIYVGDDTTDEDAFAAVRDDGLGVLVRHDDRDTAAGCVVEGPADVAALLAAFA